MALTLFRGSATAVFVLLQMSLIKVPKTICGARGFIPAISVMCTEFEGVECAYKCDFQSCACVCFEKGEGADLGAPDDVAGLDLETCSKTGAEWWPINMFLTTMSQLSTLFSVVSDKVTGPAPALIPFSTRNVPYCNSPPAFKLHPIFIIGCVCVFEI